MVHKPFVFVRLYFCGEGNVEVKEGGGSLTTIGCPAGFVIRLRS